MVVDSRLDDLDLVTDEDGGQGLLDHRPEDRHRGAYNGKVDLETGEDSRDGCPPGEVGVRGEPGTVLDDGVEASDGDQDDTDQGQQPFKSEIAILTLHRK